MLILYVLSLELEHKPNPSRSVYIIKYITNQFNSFVTYITVFFYLHLLFLIKY